MEKSSSLGAEGCRPADRSEPRGFMLTGRPPGDPLRLISVDETARRLLFSRVHIYRLVAQGKLSKPVKLGENRSAFVESEVDDFIRARIAARDGMEAV